MILRFFFILCIFSVLSCSSAEPEYLYKIPRNEIIDLIKQDKFNYAYAKFLNEDGTEISKGTRSLLNQGKLGKDYYKDKRGIIREVRVRQIELADKIIEIQKRELSSKPLSQITLIDIDCSQLDSLYAYAEKRDQDIREKRRRTDEVDSLNQQLIVSAITHCGFTEEHLPSIWLIIQHAPTALMAYYYEDLKAYSHKGLLDKSKIALTEDRLLMRHRYPQIYGSQIFAGRLYTLEDPTYVNERRKRMNLKPIEDYLAEYDLDYDEEIKRMNTDR